MNSFASRRRLALGLAAGIFAGALGLSSALPLLDAQPKPQPAAIADVSSAVRKLWDDDSPESRDAVKQALLNLTKNNGGAAEIEKALKSGPTYSAQPVGSSVLEYKGIDGAAETAGVYLPKAYDPAKQWPCIVFLHAGLNAEKGRGAKFIEEVAPLGEQLGFIIIAPSARRNAAWWQLDGAFNVLRSFKIAKGKFNIDENRVFLAGFSEGGAGAMYFAGHLSTPFAGFISFSGNPATCGGNQAYGQYSLYNLRNRPLRAVIGTKDAVFPPAVLEGHFNKMREYQVPVELAKLNVEHNFKYVAENFASFAEFLKNTTRNPYPKSVTWEWDGTASLNRCDWLMIDELRAKDKDDAELEDLDLEVGLRSLGLRFDESFKGPGVAVKSVAPNSSEEMAGLEAGDTITRINGKPVNSPTELQQAVTQGGVLVHVWVKRVGEEKEIELIAEYPPSKHVLQRMAGKLMGVATATIVGNKVTIKSRGVKKMSILISPGLFDMSKPVEVEVNGSSAFKGEVAILSEFMIDQAARDRDRKAVYVGKISFEVAKATDW